MGYNFIETLGIKLVAGKTFSRDIDNEKQIIINEEASTPKMGIKDPVGKVVKFWGKGTWRLWEMAQNFNFKNRFIST